MTCASTVFSPAPVQEILQAVRDAQLDGEIRTQEEAIRLAMECKMKV